MKKRFFLFYITCISLLIGLGTINANAQTFSGGNGSSGNPYKISSVKDLIELSNTVNEGNSYQNLHFVLTKDIDFKSNPGFDSSTLFNPIGLWIHEVKYFSASFDGRGYIIKNLTINQPNSSTGVGFFGCIGVNDGPGQRPKIKGIGIDSSCKFVGSWPVGSLVGLCYAADVENCYSKASSVIGLNQVGGFIGLLSNSTLKNCYSNCAYVEGTKLTQPAPYVGGFVGYSANYSVIENCYSVSTNLVANKNTSIGVLVGYFSNHGNVNPPKVINSYSPLGYKSVGSMPYLDSINLNVTERTFEYMKTVPFVCELNGTPKPNPAPWQRANTVSINNGYPVLSWENKGTEADCEKIFEIWNWEDLSQVIEKQDIGGYTRFKVMQNLGIPGESETYGDGSGATNVTHPGNKKYGWYGYQGFTGDEENFNVMTNISIGSGWNGVKGWKPIGYEPIRYKPSNPQSKFTSEFDGNNHTISGLWIVNNDENTQGLFGYVSGSYIHNLIVKTDNRHEEYAVGIRGKAYVGTLIGRVFNSIEKNTLISECGVYGDVLAAQWASTMVTNGLAGGLIGCVSDNSDIPSTKTVTISDCYSIGTVRGQQTGVAAAGLIGSVEICGKVKNSYASTLVSTPNNSYSGVLLGGLYAINGENFSTNCYYNNTITGAKAFSTITFNNYGSRTTDQMITKSNYNLWDFDNIWEMVEGETYPYFKWQKSAVSIENEYKIQKIEYKVNNTGSWTEITNPRDFTLTGVAQGVDVEVRYINKNAREAYFQILTLDQKNLIKDISGTFKFKTKTANQVISFGGKSKSGIIGFCKKLPLSYFVTEQGAGNKSGDSWENAMDSVLFSQSLFTAISGDTFYVAQGTYYPRLDENGEINSNSLLHSFKLNPGVTIIGSYLDNLTGTQNDYSENSPYRTILSDQELEPSTIFSGDLNRDGVVDDETDSYLILNVKNSFMGDKNLVNGIKFTRSINGTIVSEYADLTLDFCKISENKALNSSSFILGKDLSGFILGTQNGKLTLNNCIISNNIYEGDISNGYSLANGTIYVENSNLDVYNSFIAGNKAYGCSGIFMVNDNQDQSYSVNLYNSTISENINGSGYIGDYKYSGVIAFQFEEQHGCKYSLSIINTTIANNTSVFDNGFSGILLPYKILSDWGLDKYITLPADKLIIDNSIISNNEGGDFALTLIDVSTPSPVYSIAPNIGIDVFDNMLTNSYSNNKPIYSLVGKHYFDATSTHSDVGFNTTQQHLASLAYNGGYTQTIALPSVVDNYALEHGNSLYAGSNVDVRNLHKDQRGVLRKETLPSIGAYEYIKPNKTVFGTVFPFVFNSEPEFDTLFSTIAKLYAVPPTGTDPIDEIYNSAPLHVDTVENYDGSIFVPGTPKKPGTYGSINNPGYPIDWSMLGKTQGTVNTTLLTESDNIPDSPIGLYTFENVVAGDYVLVLSRAGYVTRYAKVTVSEENTIVGHRELIPGDIDGNNEIDIFDASSIRTKFSSFGDPKYDAKYDIYTDGEIDIFDVSLVNYYMGFNLEMYNDTNNWFSQY